MRFVIDEVEALAALGRLDAATELLDWYEACAGATDRRSALATSRRCRGLLADARGDHAAAAAAIEEALALHAPVRFPLDRARTLVALGRVHRRAQRRRAARDALDQAVLEFDRLGAALWAQRAREELARIGGRRGERDELTATERRVAELVGRGLSNREAAGELFLSTKTVEFHLRNIYRKLGVRSRTELARRI
jgi:DNA-binding CsgD family transcriptional regulator